MKILNRADFLKLPPGTLYCQGERWAFGPLAVKGETLDNDWSYWKLSWPGGKLSNKAAKSLDELLETGASFSAFSASGRDGNFDPDAIFLVLELRDLLALCDHANRALDVCPENRA